MRYLIENYHAQVFLTFIAGFLMMDDLQNRNDGAIVRDIVTNGVEVRPAFDAAVSLVGADRLVASAENVIRKAKVTYLYMPGEMMEGVAENLKQVNREMKRR